MTPIDRTRGNFSFIRISIGNFGRVQKRKLATFPIHSLVFRRQKNNVPKIDAKVAGF
ncbi:hypothetical protein LEP1GSC050_0833 [Leptospira broomii serovar Hurstbridge str. 5399]|uniref:Uncharacterized protein n=1 Tax=Leptospira broomii serovar Hurstbridge str. 5399 TaxID=1049789 RepID=T0GK47_9LEPT|nr:hypothetical protein LEP1GSC050_0833 [Leptospira broomii serovar Hurstbridge str. 5399]